MAARAPGKCHNSLPQVPAPAPSPAPDRSHSTVHRSVPRSRCHRRTDGADSRPPPLHSSWCRPGHTSYPGQTAPGAPEAPPPSACWTPPPSACWTPAPHGPYSPSASPYTAGPQAGQINAFHLHLPSFLIEIIPEKGYSAISLLRVYLLMTTGTTLIILPLNQLIISNPPIFL